MKQNNFYVIGGQYETICYGGTPKYNAMPV